MRDNGQDHLDALIDDTARAMTAAAPRVSLRASVRQRIERPARIPWTWQAGLAGASIVLVAFIAGRTWLSVTSEPELPRIVVEEVTPSAAPAAPPRSAVSPPVADVARTTVAARVAPNPLPPAEPIAIEPLVLELVVDPMVLAVDAIAVPMPLDIMPIVVEPISMQ